MGVTWVGWIGRGRGLRTTVEVDQRLLGDLGLDIALVLSLLQLLDRRVVRGHVGVVVLAVVQLHDLAADGGLERAVVVCEDMVSASRACSRRDVDVEEAYKRGRAGWPCRGRRWCRRGQRAGWEQRGRRSAGRCCGRESWPWSVLRFEWVGVVEWRGP